MKPSLGESLHQFEKAIKPAPRWPWRPLQPVQNLDFPVAKSAVACACLAL
jgi:hypothetical protein